MSVDEGTTSVLTVTATDSDTPSGDLTYSIEGGPDSGLFSIDSSSGQLIFSTAPDFETPLDVNGNNAYEVIVGVSDDTTTVTQAMTVTVLDVADNAPVFISPATVDVPENTTTVLTVAASDADGDTVSYEITGGADASKFSIDSITGGLVFIAPPDYENPTDVGGDNVYDVTSHCQ